MLETPRTRTRIETIYTFKAWARLRQAQIIIIFGVCGLWLHYQSDVRNAQNSDANRNDLYISSVGTSSPGANNIIIFGVCGLGLHYQSDARNAQNSDANGNDLYI